MDSIKRSANEDRTVSHQRTQAALACLSGVLDASETCCSIAVSWCRHWDWLVADSFSLIQLRRVAPYSTVYDPVPEAAAARSARSAGQGGQHL